MLRREGEEIGKAVKSNQNTHIADILHAGEFPWHVKSVGDFGPERAALRGLCRGNSPSISPERGKRFPLPEKFRS